MERIIYRKTLDVYKNGTQFLLQGFETADKLSRVIEISLMSGGDTYDFPLERVVAMMYVTTPSATEPSINACTIEDNKIVYEVLPIEEEGITTMQIKLIETSIEGAKSVLATPQFAVEVTKSNLDDNGEEVKATFTAIEEFIAKADAAYGRRLERIELTSDCMFKAYYADKTTYETDVLKRLFCKGDVLLSESFAHGGTGVRTGEDTDNSMFYSNVARSEALLAKDIMKNSQEMFEESRLHGIYTAFSVDFSTGEVEYVSPSFSFKVNTETGCLDAEGQAYTFVDEIGRVVQEWLVEKGVDIQNLQNISISHSNEIINLKETSNLHAKNISDLSETATEHTHQISFLLASVKVGTYIGNGDVLEIDLGGRPKAVLITDEYGRISMEYGGTYSFYGGLFVDGEEIAGKHRQVEITEKGFTVHAMDDIGYHYHRANHNGVKRKYIAWL